MKNEAQVATGSRAGIGRDGRGRDGRTGVGGAGARGSRVSDAARATRIAGAENIAGTKDITGTMGTPLVENRVQPRRYQRKSTSAEASSKGTDPAATATEARAGKTATAASFAAQTPNSPEPEISGPTFEVSETRELAASTIAKKAWTNRKKAKEQAEQTALTLLTILDGAIGMMLGPECTMTADEHKMIDEPLARILARMAPETTELIDRWTDPLLLATGLIMWGTRVFLVLSREVKHEARKHKAEPIKPEPAEPSMGLDLNRPIQATGIPVEVAEALG